MFLQAPDAACPQTCGTPSGSVAKHHPCVAVFIATQTATPAHVGAPEHRDGRPSPRYNWTTVNGSYPSQVAATVAKSRRRVLISTIRQRSAMLAPNRQGAEELPVGPRRAGSLACTEMSCRPKPGYRSVVNLSKHSRNSPTPPGYCREEYRRAGTCMTIAIFCLLVVTTVLRSLTMSSSSCHGPFDLLQRPAFGLDDVRVDE